MQLAKFANLDAIALTIKVVDFWQLVDWSNNLLLKHNIISMPGVL